MTLAVPPLARRADMAGLVWRARKAVGMGRPPAVVCDAARAGTSLLSVDAIAQLRLLARQADCRWRLVNVPAALDGLLAFTGLDEAVRD